MKIKIDTDEWYPVYYFSSRAYMGTEVDIPQETLDRWNKVFEDFETVQDELEKAVKGAAK